MPVFTTSRGINIYYEDINPHYKKAVAFFNGITASVKNWAYQTAVFRKSGYRVILHDSKGQLLSDKPKGLYTLSEHAAEAAELFTYLNVQGIHFIGASYGGRIAIRCALDFPNLVKTITLIDSAMELDERTRLLIEQWKQQAETLDTKQCFLSTAPFIYGDSFIKNNSALLQKWADARASLDQSCRQGKITLYESLLKQGPMSSELSKLENPVLVIWGQNDILTPLNCTTVITAGLPQAEVVIIPDCGHTPFIEKPDIVNTLLLGFISKWK